MPLMKTTQLSFWTSLGTFSDFKCDDIIIGGDFNLVLDLEKDKSGGITKTHQNSAKIIQEFSDKLDLVDAWRVLHPEARRYTWRRRRPKVQGRLDFFLVNQSVANITTLSDIYPGYKSDHSMITLKLSLHSNPRGPGLWKLNTSFLTEINYVIRQVSRKRETNIEKTTRSALHFFGKLLN